MTTELNYVNLPFQRTTRTPSLSFSPGHVPASGLQRTALNCSCSWMEPLITHAAILQVIYESRLARRQQYAAVMGTFAQLLKLKTPASLLVTSSSHFQYQPILCARPC